MDRSPFLTPKKKLKNQQGFGLIELLVSISILTLVLSIIMFRQDSFNSAVLLRSQVYEIALEARRIQLFAVSAIGGTGSNFRQQYGIHFNTAPSANSRYRPFFDSDQNPPDNHFYEGAADDFGPPGIVDQRFEIRAIRLINGSNTDTPSQLSVVFERPNFDALFFDQGTGVAHPATIAEIDIAVRGLTGTGPEVVRTLTISKTGQISVE
jgi:prepilin-type N-terminal cleavage/methylation domain-containing protein